MIEAKRYGWGQNEVLLNINVRRLRMKWGFINVKVRRLRTSWEGFINVTLDGWGWKGVILALMLDDWGKETIEDEMKFY